MNDMSSQCSDIRPVPSVILVLSDNYTLCATYPSTILAKQFAGLFPGRARQNIPEEQSQSTSISGITMDNPLVGVCHDAILDFF